MNQSLLIIGPDLQRNGVGGVTIHVQRLREYLEINGINHTFRDYKNDSIWSLVIALSKCGIVHIHVSNPFYQLALVLCGRLLRKEVVMTLHGNFGRFGVLKNEMVRLAVRSATVPIVINAQSFDECQKINKNTRLIPAFIPPQKEERLQNEVLDMFDLYKKDGKMIVATNASNTATDKFGNDIYGIDFLVQYYKESPDAVLIISDPSGNYRKLYKGLVTKSVVFIDYPHPFFQVLKHVDCFVRNTSTDGDALSVKEALFLGVPVLCTDVVDRPEGVQLFKYSDKVSFECGMKSLSDRVVTLENGAEMILGVYNSFSN